MTDCTYRYWSGVITPYNGIKWDTVQNAGTNHWHTLKNDYNFYIGVTTDTNPPVEGDASWYIGYRKLWKDITFSDKTRRLLCQWYERSRPTPANEAIIFIHGSSIIPDAWFASSLVSQAWGSTYANGIGDSAYNAGYDCYAPCVTWVNEFCNARSRASHAYAELSLFPGKDFPDLDLRRILALYDTVKAKGYSKIHLVGVSYGAQLAVLAARYLASDSALGCTTAVEGWLPTRTYIENGSPTDEWAANFEMVFWPCSPADFADLPPRTYLVYGDCNSATYSASYQTLPSSKVIYRAGAHEIFYSDFTTALAQAYP